MRKIFAVTAFAIAAAFCGMADAQQPAAPAGVKNYKNAVLLDWHGYASQHPEFFYDDAIHLRPEGAAAYAQFVSQSLGQGSP